MKKLALSKSNLLITTVSLFMLIVLMVIGTKSNKEMPKKLNYILLNPRQKINLNIFESEKYEPAVLVQQLVGTLVYYSNFGRYEPRLAEKWQSNKDNSWDFHIRSGFSCENGEEINAHSFKKSIERSIIIYEKLGGVPILPQLVGYKDFINKNKNYSDLNNLSSLEGITTKDNILTFHFEERVKSGLLQILSFTPFGYICKENFKNDGRWADDNKFISSGPYVAKEKTNASYFEFEKNKNWKFNNANAPETIIFKHTVEPSDYNQNTIIDAFTNDYENPNYINYNLVPEYLNSVLLGNFKSGFFGSKINRQKFKMAFDQNLLSTLPERFGTNTRSNTFYPNQYTSKYKTDTYDFNQTPGYELVIEGKIPQEGTPRYFAWKVLKATLESLKFRYKFQNNESNFNEMTNLDYDIRIRGSSIGGGVESWGLFVSFCSSVGIKFPDPDGRVCSLINDYEADKISDETLKSEFFNIIDDDAAILPVSHYGVKLLLSKSINSSSFSPLLAIMKLDMINLE